MRVLILSADLYQDSELTEPLRQLQAKGIMADVAAPRRGVITGMHGSQVDAVLSLDEVQPAHYDLLLLPGGKAPASLQKNAQAVAVTRYFLEQNKPVAAICHGSRLLLAAGLSDGRSATCYRDMAHELQAAGVAYYDRAVVVDGKLITSRQPADLPAFMQAIFMVLNLA
ncbi:MAG: DJ-1/PfpI/YhbO family deglycase/protease [Granulosicoccaceae bacterium]